MPVVNFLLFKQHRRQNFMRAILCLEVKLNLNNSHEWWLEGSNIPCKVIKRFLRHRKHFASNERNKIILGSVANTKDHFKHFSARAAVKISTLSTRRRENLCTNSKIPSNATLLLLLSSLIALVEF